MASSMIVRDKASFLIQSVMVNGGGSANQGQTTLPVISGYTPVAVAYLAASGTVAAATNLYDYRIADGKMVASWSPALSASYGVNFFVLYLAS